MPRSAREVRHLPFSAYEQQTARPRHYLGKLVMHAWFALDQSFGGPVCLRELKAPQPLRTVRHSLLNCLHSRRHYYARREPHTRETSRS